MAVVEVKTMLFQRVLLGSIMIAALVGLVLLDAWLSAGMPNTRQAVFTAAPGAAYLTWGLPTVLVAVLLGGAAAFELGTILRAAGYKPTVAWAALISAGLIVLPWLDRALWPATYVPSTAEMHLRYPAAPLTKPDLARTKPDLDRTKPDLDPPQPDPGQPQAALAALRSQATPIWLMAGLVGSCLLVLARLRTDGSISAMATSVLIMAYVGLLGSFLVRIRCLTPGPAGAILVLYTVLVIKSCDIGAYLLGRIFGRTPLAPWLSPKKTVEGFFAGLVLSCLVAAGGVLAWAGWGSWWLAAAPLTVPQAVLFAIFMSIMGHLGDLVESAFKRDVGVKDSGAVVASFGGFLDILDSPLFAAPAAWWLLTFLAAFQ
jgi:CDP-diglyceride synthetase